MSETHVRPATSADFETIGALSVAAYRGDGQTREGHSYEPHLRDAAARDFAAGARRLYARIGFEPAPDRDWSPLCGVTLLGLRYPLS